MIKSVSCGIRKTWVQFSLIVCPWTILFIWVTISTQKQCIIKVPLHGIVERIQSDYACKALTTAQSIVNAQQTLVLH